MAVIKGQAYTVLFYAWNSSDGTPKQGDASSITVRISKDGGPLSATTYSPSELDSTYAPGWYRVTLTDSEMNADSILVVPMSSTTGVVCQQVLILTEKGRIDVSVSSRATPSDIANTPVGLKSTEHTAIQEDVQTAMTGQGYTGARAAKLDNLDATVSSRAAPGDAMTLTSGERSSIASAVWSATTRTLTSFGTLVSDIWSHSTRTLTSFGSLANDVAQAVWAYTIEASQSALAWMRLIGSVLFGKRTYNSGNVVYRDWADSKNRIVGTEDQDGNRSITSRDGS